MAVLTLVGVLASAYFLRRTGKESRTSAQELDRRGKREETMRTLRWAAERTVSSEDRESRLGIAALGSLGGSTWLEEVTSHESPCAREVEIVCARGDVKRAQARGVAVDPDVEAIANATPAAYLLDESEDARADRPEP